jgi:hypothetical protein
MKALAIAMSIAVLAAAGPAWAELLAYDGFDYSENTPMLGKTNPFTGNDWLLAGGGTLSITETTAINVGDGSLGLPAELPAAAGNSVAITGVGNMSGATNRLALSHPVTSGTVYYSVSVRIDDVTAATITTGGFFVGLNNEIGAANKNPGSVAARLQVRKDPTDSTKYNLGIVRNKGANQYNIPWTGPMTTGETLFLVASVEMVDGTINDIARLWINPGNLGEATAPAPTLIDNTTDIGTDITVASVILRQSPTPSLKVDELRVGTTWADVTPEPTAVFLLGLGLCLLPRRRRA